ncbi:MAG: acetate/propionate family kinase, partial [Methylobacter sp.]
FYRYGFHGISCQHSLSAAADLLDRDQATLNLIVLHLGGGASITAIRGGVSVDTSMGFSPVEGLIMSGRCGDLDPMIPLTLQRQGMSLDQLDYLLNHQSGLTGICGKTDMRDILKKAGQGEPTALLALDMYCYRIKKYIGAYCAILGEVSALVFTGGIGEHAPAIRHKILQGLDKLGFSLDLKANQRQTEQIPDISDQNSHSRILVISSEEEREIARQIAVFLAGSSIQ